MSFIRSFDDTQKNKLLSKENAQLLEKLKADIYSGKKGETVFPAVRKNEIYFYYKGGCLYKFSHGMFRRDARFRVYGKDAGGLSEYERAKKENENKFTSAIGGATERRLLNDLYCRTFDPMRKTSVVALDIEVNLNGRIGGGKKCDLVLLNTETKEVMFVEGKVFFDGRVNVAAGFTPEVISQVNTYSAAISEQEQNIIMQYAEHVRIVNELFGTNLVPPEKVILPAKLLVYKTPLNPTSNQKYSIEKINDALGCTNVVWYKPDEEPPSDRIWCDLTK